MFVADSSVVLLLLLFFSSYNTISSFQAEIIECWFEMFLGHMLYSKGQNIRIRNHMLFLPFQFFFFFLLFFNFILLSYLSLLRSLIVASKRREPFKTQYKTENFRPPKRDQMLPAIVRRAIFHFQNSLCSSKCYCNLIDVLSVPLRSANGHLNFSWFLICQQNIVTNSISTNLLWLKIYPHSWCWSQNIDARGRFAKPVAILRSQYY